MPFENVMKRAAIGATVALSLKGIHRDPKRSIRNAVDLFDCFTRGIFDERLLARIRQDVVNPKSCFFNMVIAMVRNVDHSILKRVGTDLCYNRVAAKKSKRDTPVKRIRMESISGMDSAVSHGRELGVYLYIIYGRKPLHRREEILSMCRKYPDCAFYIQADGKDINESFAADTAEAGNIILSVNVHAEQPRRCYGHIFQILQKHRCLYGYSVRLDAKRRVPFCQKEFIDSMAKCGCLFGWYCNGFQKKQLYFKTVRDMMCAASSAGVPLLLLNTISDDRLTNRFSTGGRCYLFFGKKKLKTKYRLAAAKGRKAE